MGYQFLYINKTPFNACDTRRPRIFVSVDESKLDLWTLLVSCISLKGRIPTSARDRCIKGRLFIIDRPTPTTIRTPPRRTIKAAEQTLLSMPVHSYTTLG